MADRQREREREALASQTQFSQMEGMGSQVSTGSVGTQSAASGSGSCWFGSPENITAFFTEVPI